MGTAAVPRGCALRVSGGGKAGTTCRGGSIGSSASAGEVGDGEDGARVDVASVIDAGTRVSSPVDATNKAGCPDDDADCPSVSAT